MSPANADIFPAVASLSRKYVCVRRQVCMGRSIDQRMELGTRNWHPPQIFAGADDIINNLAKEREPGIEII